MKKQELRDFEKKWGRFGKLNLEIPSVRILRANFYRGIHSWNWKGCVPYWILMRSRSNGMGLISHGRRFELSPKVFLLLPPMTDYMTFVTEEREFDQFYIHFTTGSYMRGILPHPLVIPGEDDPELFFSTFKEKGKLPEHFHELKYYSILFDLLLRIPEKAFVYEQEKTRDLRITAALDYIDTHLEKSLTNQEICRHVGMSLNNFLRLFRRDEGISPKRYIILKRVFAATKLLLESDDSIAEIAEKCGFSDRYHLSKVLLREADSTPGQLRKRSL